MSKDSTKRDPDNPISFSKNQPNKETLKVFEETDKGLNLTTFKSKDNLFKDLDYLNKSAFLLR